MRAWLVAAVVAAFGSVLLGLFVERHASLQAFFVEDGPVEVLQAIMLVVVAGVFLAASWRSRGSRALFCLLAGYGCIFAVTREIPRCGSAFTGGGACLTSGWKETIVLSASALGLLALLLRPIDWRDAVRLSNLLWVWPSFVILGLLGLAEVFESFVYYSEIEEMLELLAYLYLGAFALSILRQSEGRPAH